MDCVTTFFLLFSLVCPRTASSSFLTTIFGESVCKEVECGKGNCTASPDNSSYPYECQCTPGWTQVNADLKFLPCVIPNCTMDFSCSNNSSPVQDKDNQTDTTIFDPCYWSDCGGGTCNKTSMFTHKCECSEGYYNLLNISAFPCYRECAIGMDCKSLGITFMNQSSSSTSSSVTSNMKNQASNIPTGNIVWLIMLASVFLPGLLVK